MKQGEIWLVDLNPTVGAEMQKVRPALIVNADDLGRLPLKIIVPVTDWKDRSIRNQRIDQGVGRGLLPDTLCRTGKIAKKERMNNIR